MRTALALALEHEERRPQAFPQRTENVVHLWTLCCLALEESQRATSFVLILHQLSPEQGDLRYGTSTFQSDTRQQACTARTDHCIARDNACCRRAWYCRAWSEVGISRHQGPAGWTGTDEWSVAQGPPDRGKCHPGRSQQREGAPAAVKRGGVRKDRLVHPPGCLRRRAGACPGRDLCAQARQYRHRLPRL